MSTSISILGNTGGNVELRYTPQGTPVANFSMASNSVRKTKDGKQKKTDWYNITAFGKLAETIARNVRKGSHIFVQGRLTFNPWLTRDGEPRVGADVVLQDFEFAGGSPVSASQNTETSAEMTGGDTYGDAEMIDGSGGAPKNSGETEPYIDQF